MDTSSEQIFNNVKFSVKIKQKKSCRGGSQLVIGIPYVHIISLCNQASYVCVCIHTYKIYGMPYARPMPVYYHIIVKYM